ncbi:MAG: phosphotransferase [Candidatus Cloacimonetes bacterium]|nr:phosphotransferase [Candidatus Cloacimonadota bacterium]
MHKDIPNSVWDHFFDNLTVESCDSIYTYAPVFKIKTTQNTYVLKQTRSPLTDANKITSWCESMQKIGLSIVTPVALSSSNPMLHEEEVWIVYPFYDGVQYIACNEQIAQAGDYLGRMHQANDSSITLPQFEFPDEVSFESFTQDYNQLLSNAKANSYSISEKLHLHLQNQFTKFEGLVDKLSTLVQDQNIVWTNATWDYKANNLIFRKQNDPCLIDPDNGGYLPRVFDLALAVLLFHNELPSAPHRLFNHDQWSVFITSYKKHVTLSDQEISLWPDAINFMALDEAIWLLGDDQDGWKDNHQGQFLYNLANSFTELTNRFTID